MIEVLSDRQKALGLRNTLWLYCQQDTQTMVDLVRELEDIS
jgi:hypothetical protein